jgi:hypothetical protein
LLPSSGCRLKITALFQDSIRLSVVLMEATQETEGDALKDWYYNKPPTNNVEQVYGLLQQILMDLSESVLAIEGEYTALVNEMRRFDLTFALVPKANIQGLHSWATQVIPGFSSKELQMPSAVSQLT